MVRAISEVKWGMIIYITPSEHELSHMVFFFNQGVIPLLAPTLTSHLKVRLLDPLHETNSAVHGCATGGDRR